MRSNIKENIKRIFTLFVGLFLYAIGIVMTINANLGLAPWDVFHQGLAKTIGITIGQANISIGLILVIVGYLMGEKLGWGSLSNMLFIGIFVDLLMLNDVIPVFESYFARIIMLLLGMFVTGIASYLYINVGLGSGPRDSLMVLLTKRTKKSVQFNRSLIEITVSILGYFLGGSVGFGTVVVALTMGYFVQLTFKLFKFDIKKVTHRFIEDDIRYIKKYLSKVYES